MLEAHYASIDAIHRAYREKTLTVRGLVLQFLARIAALDRGPDGLNAVLEINPDALFLAEGLDRELAGGREPGGMFGIPVLLKDNINTGDKLHTSGGSLALAGNYAPGDAHLAACLRRAGAVILGKANMTELANYMSRDGMPAGYSSRGGQVLNPHNRKKSPSGSSAGSAVAVAAGLCTVSVGTETAGSIICPAGQNGIVGLKPTLGLVSRQGILPISGTHDTAGPMARSVRDAAILLEAMAVPDPSGDAACSFPGTPTDYANRLDGSLEGVRIGVNRSRTLTDFVRNEESRQVFDAMLRTLREHGAILIDHVDMDASFAIGKIMRFEFKGALNHYLSTLGDRSAMKSLADIIAFNQTHAASALKYGQSVLLDAENATSGAHTEPEYLEALLEREEAMEKLDRLFDENRLDVMLCETFTNLAPFTGFPALTIPLAARKDRLPLDSYWMARRYDEATLLRVADGAERVLNVRVRPRETMGK